MGFDRTAPCGCHIVDNGEQIEISVCGGEHALEPVAFWRAVAHSMGVPFSWARSSSRSMGGALPCGCRWYISDGDFHVLPCSAPGHEEHFTEAAKAVALESGIPLREVD